MLIGDVRPTSVAGVKRLAAQLRRQQGIKHADALDLAAVAASCSNFRHARRVLPERAAASLAPYLLLTAYWIDKDQGYRCGRETLRVELSRPWPNICAKSELRSVRGFGNLRMVADDHFVCDALYRAQEHAQDRLLMAERSLRFMEHTGLRPARNHRRAYRRNEIIRDLPGIDHPTEWVDPGTGQFVLVDEPYGDRSRWDERGQWASRHGWQMEKTSWSGMYSPLACELYIASEDRPGFDFAALKARIDAMPRATLERSWTGESVRSWETFVSPLATSPQARRRARCRGTISPNASAATLPYSFSMGSSRRRPRGALGIEGHVLAGRMIKAVAHTRERPFSVYRRMNSLRCTLEDWLGLELEKGQLEGPEFFEVYYHELAADDPFRQLAASREGLLGLLADLGLMLKRAYPDCAPLRKQLALIERSQALITRHRTGPHSEE